MPMKWRFFFLAAFIPEEIITDIKNATNIVDVISEFVLLKKQGLNYIGLCPFHSEKTPSFTVSAEKQIFHCFGCSCGGNVFNFLMKHQGLSFPEAVRQLARHCGKEIPIQPISPDQKRQMNEREIIFDINQKAMGVFYNTLKSTNAGNRALAYLAGRGISEKTIDQFYLGYASGGWETLANFFSKKAIPYAVVEKAGLIIPRKGKNGYYDRFRNRIIFPIFDINKKVIGFGGRSMDDSLPKYLNSPETPVYHKSRSLYGLYHARKKCRESDTVYLVEGYFDFLSLYQNGIQNVVATLGTALTSEHLRLLKGYAGKIILVYDSDEAGVNAAFRSIGIIRKEGFDAKIVILPSGYDPDAFMLKFGSEAFNAACAEALDIIPFLVDASIKKHGLSIEGKIRIIEELAGTLSTLDNRTARSLYVKNIAESINVDESAIWEKITENAKHNDINSRKTFPEKSGAPQDRKFMDSSRAMIQSGRKNFEEKGERFERKILSMMLQFHEIIPEVEKRDIVGDFNDELLKSIGYFIIKQLPDCHFNVSTLVNMVNDETQKNVITHLAIGNHPWDREGCLNLLTQFELNRSREKNNLLKKIIAAEESNNYELLDELLKDKQHQVSRKINLAGRTN